MKLNELVGTQLRRVMKTLRGRAGGSAGLWGEDACHFALGEYELQRSGMEPGDVK